MGKQTFSDVRLLTESFDPAEALRAFTEKHNSAGGIVSFLGQVRGSVCQATGEPVEALELKHYGPLTLPAMEGLAKDVQARWDLHGLMILHRSGEMYPSDPIVFVAAAASHRRDAFEAVDFTMDHLKSESWFWKRERVVGKWRWIEPREQDFKDIARWSDMPQV